MTMCKNDELFLFGLLLLSWVTGLAFGNTKGPFGPKMCDRFCRRRNWCASYSLSTSSLTCHLTDRYPPLVEQGENLLNIGQAKIKTCPHYSVVVYTRRHIWKCLKDSDDGGIEKHEDLDLEKSLLVAQTKNKLHRLHQIFLSDKPKKQRHFIRAKLVEAIAYISKTREFLISSASPKGITAFSEARKTGKFLSDERTVSMAIDEDKGLVFFTHIHRGINRMSLDGGNFERLTKDMLYYSISVDTISRRFYIIKHTKFIISADYNGEDQRRICSGKGLKLLMYDPKDDTLYFTQNNEVFELRNHLTEQVSFVSFAASPNSLVYYDGKIYVTFKGGNYILEASSESIDRKIITSFQGGADLMICAVP